MLFTSSILGLPLDCVWQSHAPSVCPPSFPKTGTHMKRAWESHGRLLRSGGRKIRQRIATLSEDFLERTEFAFNTSRVCPNQTGSRQRAIPLTLHSSSVPGTSTFNSIFILIIATM